MVVPDNHWTGHKCIHPKPLDLIPQFGSIEGSSHIRPIRLADQPFVTVDQLLASNLGNQGKELWISDLNKSLVQIYRIQIGIRIWFIPIASAVPALRIEIQPGRRLVPDMNKGTQEHE